MTVASKPFGTRLDILEIDASAEADFAADVASAWGGDRKRCLPPKYFYDATGSALFEAITQLPDYYLTRAETEIISLNARRIIDAFGGPLSLVELGSGSALKTRLLIDAVLRSQNTLHFSPIDISRDALNASASELIDTFPRLFVRALIGDYFDVLRCGAVQVERHEKVLALCLGSNIGNYNAGDAQRLMEELAAFLRPGDGLLLGIDMKKDSDTLERAYNDEDGLMSQFSTNLLVRMNRELGASFNPDDFVLTVVCNGERGSVDSFLRSRRAHDVTMLGGRLSVHFDEDELVPMESSFKYGPNDVARLAYRNGFKVTNVWHDKAGRFASYLLVRRLDRRGNVIGMPTAQAKIKTT